MKSKILKEYTKKYYNYNDLSNVISQKERELGIQLWDYLVHHREIHNGSFIYFNPSEILEDFEDDLGFWKREYPKTHHLYLELFKYIVILFEKEGLPNKIELYVSW